MNSSTQAPSVTDVLTGALNWKKNVGKCAVQAWVDKQGPEEADLMRQIIDMRNQINLAKLYQDLKRNFDVPFSNTLFRYHTAGECTCR